MLVYKLQKLKYLYDYKKSWSLSYNMVFFVKKNSGYDFVYNISWKWLKKTAPMPMVCSEYA
jgi:hypothetical protein